MFVLHHISSLVHSWKLLCPAEKLPADGALGRKTENVGKTTSRLRNIIFQKKNAHLRKSWFKPLTSNLILYFSPPHYTVTSDTVTPDFIKKIECISYVRQDQVYTHMVDVE